MLRITVIVFIIGSSIAPLCRGDLQSTQVTGTATLPPSTANQFDPSVQPEPPYCKNQQSTTAIISDLDPGQYDFCAIFARRHIRNRTPSASLSPLTNE